MHHLCYCYLCCFGLVVTPLLKNRTRRGIQIAKRKTVSFWPYTSIPRLALEFGWICTVTYLLTVVISTAELTVVVAAAAAAVALAVFVVLIVVVAAAAAAAVEAVAPSMLLPMMTLTPYSHCYCPCCY